MLHIRIPFPIMQKGKKDVVFIYVTYIYAYKYVNMPTKLNAIAELSSCKLSFSPRNLMRSSTLTFSRYFSRDSRSGRVSPEIVLEGCLLKLSRSGRVSSWKGVSFSGDNFFAICVLEGCLLKLTIWQGNSAIQQGEMLLLRYTTQTPTYTQHRRRQTHNTDTDRHTTQTQTDTKTHTLLNRRNALPNCQVGVRRGEVVDFQ